MQDNFALIDFESGLKRMMNNTPLYIKLLKKFVVAADENMKNLKGAVVNNDFETAGNAVHALKGLTASLSLMKLNSQCLELEGQIKKKSINNSQIAVLNEIYVQTLGELEKVVAQNE